VELVESIATNWPECAFWWQLCRSASHQRTYWRVPGSDHTWCRRGQTEGWESV